MKQAFIRSYEMKIAESLQLLLFDDTFSSVQNEFYQLLSSMQDIDFGTLTTSPLSLSLATVAIAIVWSWLYNFTGWWSTVDMMWSIIPMIYATIFMVLTGFQSRIVLIASLIFLWGMRLTYNFHRKGGYSGHEDYRWSTVRSFFGKSVIGIIFREAFSFSFIALFQHLLIWGFSCLPLYVVSLHPEIPISNLDRGLAGLFLILLLLQTITDNAQWQFQSRKHSMTLEERSKLGGDYSRGFLTSGPFRLSRHLNFFCEQSMWWVVYLLGISTFTSLQYPDNSASLSDLFESLVMKKGLIHWSAAGAFVLTLLFQGSTVLTEAITLRKYPLYRVYQRTTSRIVPWFPGPTLDSVAGQNLIKKYTSGR